MALLAILAPSFAAGFSVAASPGAVNLLSLRWGLQRGAVAALGIGLGAATVDTFYMALSLDNRRLARDLRRHPGFGRPRLRRNPGGRGRSAGRRWRVHRERHLVHDPGRNRRRAPPQGRRGAPEDRARRG